MDNLSEEAKELLDLVKRRGAMTMQASQIVGAAELIVAGIVEAHDDQEGIWLSLRTG